MKKIKLIPIIIFLTCSNLINAQNEFALKEIDSVSKTMFQSVIDKDFDLLLEMTYSKIYDIIPKDMMLQAIKSIFEGNDENTKNTWKTIRYDSDSPMFYQILPAEIIKHAKTYKEDLMIESSQKN